MSLFPSIALHNFWLLTNTESNCSFTQRWKLCKGNSLHKYLFKTNLSWCLFYSEMATLHSTGVRNIKTQGLHRTEAQLHAPVEREAVRPLLFCKALFLSLKPEKLCAGLSGMMGIQNSVRARPGCREVSCPLGRQSAGQNSTHSSGTLCQHLLPGGTARGFWTYCTDSCWLHKQTRLSLTACSFCLWSPHPSSGWLSTTSRKTASKTTLFQRQCEMIIPTLCWCWHQRNEMCTIGHLIYN